MKKIILSAALLGAVVAGAPEAQAQSIKFGAVGGLNLTKLSIKTKASQQVAEVVNRVLDEDNRTGWFIGPKVWVSTPLGLSFDGALEYSQRRIKIDEDGETLRSLEIPINVRYNFGLGSIASAYISTGPQFGFNIGNMNGDDWTDAALGILPGQQSSPVFDKSNMCTTWNIGAGVKVLGHLELGIGYNFAIGKVGKTLIGASGNGNYLGEVEYKANTFQVQAAYIF